MKKNTTKKTLATLAIAGMTLTMIPFNAFADTGVTTARLFGSDRIGTAVAVADAGWTTADTAILAPSADANLVDALAAAPLAGKAAPILLTDNNTLTAATQAELVKLGVKNVYVVGAINQTVVDQVNAMSGVKATVLKGTDRIGTAAAISAKLTAPAGSFVVGYGALADALSVASYAAANNYSILVANPDGSLPASEAAYKGTNVYIVGGPTLVADIAGATRLFGADRFATNQAVLKALTYKYDQVYVANGTDAHLVDSLVASSLAAQTSAPIVLTDTNGAAAANDVHAKLAGKAVVTALGGSSVVSDADVAQVTTGAAVVPVTPVTPVTPVSIGALAVTGQLVGTGALSSPAVATVNSGITVASTVSGASAANASITYLVTTSSNITAKDANGNTLSSTSLSSPIIVGTDTFTASYTVPADTSGNVKAVFSSTASSTQSFNVVVEAPFSNNGQPVMSSEASMEWGVPGTTVLSPVYPSSSPDNLNFSSSGKMKGLVPVVATILPAAGSTTAVSGQPIKFTMSLVTGTSNYSADTNAFFTDSTGTTMVASGGSVGKGVTAPSVTYVVNTDTNGQALVYINANAPTTNGLVNPGGVITVDVGAQLVNGGGSTNTGRYQWKAVSQPTKIANVTPSAVLNGTGLTATNTVANTNAETATNGSQITLAGTLQDSAGNPVANAQVAIQDYDIYGSSSQNVQNDAFVLNGTTTLFSAVNYPMVTTDSNGNFSVVVTANVPVTQSVLDSITQYYAYYVPSTVAVTSGQSLPTTAGANVTPMTFVGNQLGTDAAGNQFVNIAWQQGLTAQSVGVSHTSLMPTYASLSTVPQTASFNNVVGSNEQMYAAAYNQTGSIIAPATNNQFNNYALTYDITAPTGMVIQQLGSQDMAKSTSAPNVYPTEVKAHYYLSTGFGIDSITYTDGTTTLTPASTLFPNLATAYDGSGQINFYLNSDPSSSTVVTSGTAGSVNVNIAAYADSLSGPSSNEAEGSASGTINANFAASNTISSLGVAGDVTGISGYAPLLQGNAAPGSSVSVAGVAIPGGNAFSASSNSSFVVAPFNSYPALGSIPSQGLTLNMTSSKNGTISNVDGYVLASTPSNVSVNVDSQGEVAVNNVKIWSAQSGYQVVGYMPGSPAIPATATTLAIAAIPPTLIEQGTSPSTNTNFIGVTVPSVGATGSIVAYWTVPSTSLAGNFESYLGFNVDATTGQLQPMVASHYESTGSFATPVAGVAVPATATAPATALSAATIASISGAYAPIEVATVYGSDKYSEAPVVTIGNSLNSQTATVTENFTASSGGLVAIKTTPSSVNSVLGSSQNITLTAQDAYGNPLPNQTIYLGTGPQYTGLWITQINGAAITGSVNLGSANSTSMNTINTPVPFYNVASVPGAANGPAYTSASTAGLTAYNLNCNSATNGGNPVIALTTGTDGTVSITLADGNVTFVASAGAGNNTTTNSYVVAPGVHLTSQTLYFAANPSTTTPVDPTLASNSMGSIKVNW